MMAVACDKEESAQDTHPKDMQDSQPHKSCLALGGGFVNVTVVRTLRL